MKYIDTKINDLGTIVTGKTPSTSDEENFGNDYMFITPNELHQGYIVRQSQRMLSKKGFDNIKSNTIAGESVLVGCIGWDMGNIAMSLHDCATNQQINSITQFKKEYNPFYIYYWLSMKKKYLFQCASVTRTPILSKSAFSEICIPIPDKNYQDKIVAVLQTVDAKIEQNNKINAELESMAKTIYDYWFTQFDFPDENGRPYKSSGGKMVWNEELHREIPAGWEVGDMNEVAELYQPQTISGNDLISNGKYFVFGANGIIGKYDKYNHEENEVAITCRGASCGNVLMTLPKSWITGNAMVVKPLPAFPYKEYLYYTVKKSDIEKCVSGSAQPQITRTNLEIIRLLKPNRYILGKFESNALKIREKMIKNIKENNKLINLRDWLLPMLMNGQIIVDN